MEVTYAVIKLRFTGGYAVTTTRQARAGYTLKEIIFADLPRTEAEALAKLMAAAEEDG